MKRRELLVVTGSAWLASACGSTHAPLGRPKDPDDVHGGSDEDVTPSEDLMREHGVLNRVLLVYEEGARRLETNGPSPNETLARAAGIVRRFVEDYHEKLEEEFLFPRFEAAKKHVELVTVLRQQHQAGRRVTEEIQRLSAAPDDAANRAKLVAAIRAFARMYRPHETREDTVLFPAIREVIPKRELEDLGERFENREHQLFGKEGFEGIVAQVADLERALAIHDLAQFTPA